MRRLNNIIIIFLSIALSNAMYGSVLAQNTEGKIPITTSSDAALEYYLMGRDLNEKLRFQDSRDFFVRAIEEDPEFAMGYLSLAAVQTTTPAFFESFNKAKSLMDKVSEGERLMILGVEAGGIEADPIKQQGIYKKLVQAYPNDERAHNLLAQSYFGQLDYENAIAEYEMVIKINPEFTQAYNQLGYSYGFLGKYPAAEKVLQKYISLLPYDPNPYDSYAELLMKIGKFDESIDNYQKALDLNPSFTPSYLGIASNLMFKGEYDKACSTLQEFHMLSLDDNQRRTALFAIALVYLDEGDFTKVLETLEKRMDYAEVANDTGTITGDMNTIGNVLLEDGKIDEALDIFMKSLNMIKASSLTQSVIDLNDLTYFYNAAHAYSLKGDFEKAKSFSGKFAHKADMTQSPTQLRLTHEIDGFIALEEKDFSTAITELNQANLQNPYNLYRLGLAYEGMGDKIKAKEHFDLAANYNISSSMNYIFVRKKASQKLSLM